MIMNTRGRRRSSNRSRTSGFGPPPPEPRTRRPPPGPPRRYRGPAGKGFRDNADQESFLPGFGPEPVMSVAGEVGFDRVDGHELRSCRQSLTDLGPDDREMKSAVQATARMTSALPMALIEIGRAKSRDQNPSPPGSSARAVESMLADPRICRTKVRAADWLRWSGRRNEGENLFGGRAFEGTGDFLECLIPGDFRNNPPSGASAVSPGRNGATPREAEPAPEAELAVVDFGSGWAGLASRPFLRASSSWHPIAQNDRLRPGIRRVSLPILKPCPPARPWADVHAGTAELAPAATWLRRRRSRFSPGAAVGEGQDPEPRTSWHIRTHRPQRMQML